MCKVLYVCRAVVYRSAAIRIVTVCLQIYRLICCKVMYCSKKNGYSLFTDITACSAVRYSTAEIRFVIIFVHLLMLVVLFVTVLQQ